jgi:hypothetical protein
MLEQSALNGIDSTCVETILKWWQLILRVLGKLSPNKCVCKTNFQILNFMLYLSASITYT